jgi:hypothetical protein
LLEQSKKREDNFEKKLTNDEKKMSLFMKELLAVQVCLLFNIFLFTIKEANISCEDRIRKLGRDNAEVFVVVVIIFILFYLF